MQKKECKAAPEKKDKTCKEMVTKVTQKDHSDMIFNWWKELDKMAHSPILFIQAWVRALAEQFAREEGFKLNGESTKGGNNW